MIFNKLIHNRRSILKKLAKSPPSPARSRLIQVMKMKAPDLAQAAANTWMNENYGSNLEPTIPSSLIPDLDHDEFFQLITDTLKSSI